MSDDASNFIGSRRETPAHPRRGSKLSMERVSESSNRNRSKLLGFDIYGTSVGFGIARLVYLLSVGGGSEMLIATS